MSGYEGLYKLDLLLLASDFGDSAAQLQSDFGDGRQHVTLPLARRHARGSSSHLDLQGGSLGVLLPRPLPLLVLLLVLFVLLVISPTSLSLLSIEINNMFHLRGENPANQFHDTFSYSTRCCIPFHS